MINLIVMNNSLLKDEKVEYIKKAYQPSPGIMYISSYMKDKGYDVDSLNMNHYLPNKLEEVLSENHYDVLGLGGLFIFLNDFKSIIKLTRKVSPSTKILLGGQIATADPEFAIGSIKPDYLIMGEAEHIMTDFLDALENDRDLKSVNGIIFSEGDQLIKTTDAIAPTDLDSLPYPDYEGFEFDYKLDNFPLIDQTSIHPENARQIGIIASRGCPAKCTFCYLIAGDNVRVRSTESVVSEIIYLKKRFNANDVVILDDLFATNKQRVLEFSEKIKPLNIGWQCQMRVNQVDEEMLYVMKDAGCYQVSYGFESASKTVLKSMQKGITVKKIENAINLTRKAKITIQANFIFGDKAETYETAYETLKFARKYKFNRLGKISPYPGTSLYTEFIKGGKVKDLETFYTTGRGDDGKMINMTKMPDNEFQHLYKRVIWWEKNYREFGKITGINKIKIDPNQRSGMFNISVICPFCGYESKDKKIYEKNTKLEYFLPKIWCTCSDCNQRFYLYDLDFSDANYLKKLIIRFQREFILKSNLIYYSSTKFLYVTRLLKSIKYFLKKYLNGSSKKSYKQPLTSSLNLSSYDISNNQSLKEKKHSRIEGELPFEDNSLSELEVSSIDETHM